MTNHCMAVCKAMSPVWWFKISVERWKNETLWGDTDSFGGIYSASDLTVQQQPGSPYIWLFQSKQESLVSWLSGRSPKIILSLQFLTNKSESSIWVGNVFEAKKERQKLKPFFAYGWRVWNLNWPIRIQQAGRIVLSWSHCKWKGIAWYQPMG